MSWWCRRAVNSHARKGYATCRTTLSPRGPILAGSPDPLTGPMRDGARELIAQTIEAELATLLATLLAAFADDMLGRTRKP